MDMDGRTMSLTNEGMFRQVNRSMEADSHLHEESGCSLRKNK